MLSYLLAISLMPSIALMVYVYKKDRCEKEPLKLLALLFGVGVFSCIPAIICELIFDSVNTNLFKIIGFSAAQEDLGKNIIYQFVDNFLGVALFEEFFKWLFMYLVTRNNKNFNSLFDGIVYAVFVSMGFASFENIFYVLEGGLSTAAIRAVTSIPGHMFFGVFMGYYYGQWHLQKVASDYEKIYAKCGLITIKPPAFSGGKYMALCLIVPILFHGFYDFCLSVDSALFNLVFFIFLIFLYIKSFSTIKKMSASDIADHKVVTGILYNKYPELIQIHANSNYNQQINMHNQQTDYFYHLRR